VRERGKLVTTREGHNIMVDAGRAWLASLISYSQFSPDVGETSDRIRYMGAGIGGVSQGNIPATISAPIVTTYPVGFDPTTSGGNDYNDEFPVAPLITTLERPVKISGSTNPYAAAPGTDVWLMDTPNARFFNTHQDLTSATFHGRLVGAETILAGFTSLPLSEVGLFTDGTGVDINSAYSPIIAYFSFDTIQKNSSNTVEFIWSLRF